VRQAAQASIAGGAPPPGSGSGAALALPAFFSAVLSTSALSVSSARASENPSS